MVYVSKLEMRGFKSFGRKKEVVPLSSGLTAVVGPNGSGKSNIIDAISFVLGQRSSQALRASEFADVIYHGGGEEGKNPASYAKVTLHIVDDDNSLNIDEEEFTISRKVNKDGKSTYKLAGARTTRTEIVDLLKGKLIGNEGYNFVMQGDVDKFIKMSSLERRKIIEDIAGIAEFEEKKEKSIRELDKVSTQLQSEEGRLEVLQEKMEESKEDKKDVQKYKKLKENLTEKKFTLASMEVESRKKDLEKVGEKIEKKEEELKELEQEKEDLKDKIGGLKEEKDELKKLIREKRDSEVLKEVERLNSRLETLKENLEEDEKSVSQLDTKINNLKEDAEEAAEKSEEKTPIKKVEKYSEDFDNRFSELKKLIEKVEEVDKESKDFDETLSEIKSSLGEIENVIQKLNNYFREVVKSKKEFLELAEEKDKIEEAGSEFERLRTKLTSAKAKRDDAKDRVEKWEKEISECKESLKEAKKDSKEIKSGIEDKESEKQSLDKEMREITKEINEIDNKISSKESEISELKLDENSAKKDLEQAKEDLEEYDGEEIEEFDGKKKKLENKIQKLEKRIEKLKPINEKAPEQFKKAKEQYDTQKGHYDELAQEKETLLEHIEKIDEKKASVFMETFEKVSENFSNIFSELSPGGEGKLTLEDPENPLDAGLDIEAKPQGKKLRSATSLSGGEKALTGLAFIFAIQKTKPSAIYIFDEIDAHLDPQNRKGVAELVKSFSEEAQITIVTLHESVMAAADKLFGVNMDDDDISHIVSVNLEEIKEEI